MTPRIAEIKQAAHSGELLLPWPPKELTPNFKRRKHWTVYRVKQAKYRADCYVLTKAARVRGTLLSITFYPPDRRKRDDDGMIGAFKSGRDGVADALGCDDHTFRPTYRFGEPVKGGAILVEIGELF
jgi:crossover junction endodeoxyribonuclease RusA